eukprot:1137157-Pelagomonas_calceolata.AAC.1
MTGQECQDDDSNKVTVTGQECQDDDSEKITVTKDESVKMMTVRRQHDKITVNGQECQDDGSEKDHSDKRRECQDDDSEKASAATCGAALVASVTSEPLLYASQGDHAFVNIICYNRFHCNFCVSGNVSSRKPFHEGIVTQRLLALTGIAEGMKEGTTT